MSKIAVHAGHSADRVSRPRHRPSHPRKRSGLGVDSGQERQPLGDSGVAEVDQIKTVADALSELGHRELQGISVRILNGCILLGGTVSSYHRKQIAQNAAHKAVPSLTIRNELHVIWPTMNSASS